MFAITMVLIDSDYNKSGGVEKTTLIIRSQTNWWLHIVQNYGCYNPISWDKNAVCLL